MNDLVASAPSVSRSLTSLTCHPLLHFFCVARDVKWGAGYSPRSREARNKQHSPASACTPCAGHASAGCTLEDTTEWGEEYLDGRGGVRSVDRSQRARVRAEPTADPSTSASTSTSTRIPRVSGRTTNSALMRPIGLTDRTLASRHAILRARTRTCGSFDASRATSCASSSGTSPPRDVNGK